jgi:hypothetical protein
MMRTDPQTETRSRLLYACTCLLLVGQATMVHAGQEIGVGTDPPPPMGPFLGNDDQDDMIMVGSPSNPVGITPVLTGPPWMKEFVINRDGQGWSPDGPLSMVTVMEVIQILPSTRGTTLRVVDWHEDIDRTVADGGNFKWAGGSIDTPFGSFPGMTSTDGSSIWFNFPPLPPLVPFKITKQLMWTGPVITPGQTGMNDYRIKINERPSIPEPSTLALAGMAIAVSTGLSRRFRH